MKFYLGTHMPSWLSDPALAGIRLFVSDRRLRARKNFSQSVTDWALDSGGFTEVSQHGRYLTTPREYAGRVRRYRDNVGRLQWAAPQDWMCEPFVLSVTGLTVADHQARTISNLLTLRAEAPDLPWVPVLQGWTEADYLRCVDLYAVSGVDLTREPLVGVGSVCRRQATAEGERIFRSLAGRGLRLHGFGLKTDAIRRYGSVLASSDLMAWSFQARRRPPLPACSGHVRCNNCVRYALLWRSNLGRVD